jgi:hypothetical protein
MNRPLHEFLDESGRAHLARLLAASAADELHARIREFMAGHVELAPEAEAAFLALPARERERLLSELAWRVTCHLDGSVTRVLGAHVLALGYGFSAAVSEQSGRDVFVLVEDR